MQHQRRGAIPEGAKDKIVVDHVFWTSWEDTARATEFVVGDHLTGDSNAQQRDAVNSEYNIEVVESASVVRGKTALDISSDLELATMISMSSLCHRRSHQTLPCHSPAYDSRFAVRVENCNKLVKEQRVKPESVTRASTGVDIKLKGVLTTRMIRHSAELRPSGGADRRMQPLTGEKARGVLHRPGHASATAYGRATARVAVKTGCAGPGAMGLLRRGEAARLASTGGRLSRVHATRAQDAAFPLGMRRGGVRKSMLTFPGHASASYVVCVVACVG